MSHSDKKGILGVDGKSIPVDDITAKFKGNGCSQLLNKPKLFFLQACRGDFDNEGHYVPTTSFPGQMLVKQPLDADFLIAFSTTKGYIFHRRFGVSEPNIWKAGVHGSRFGSRYIQCLMQILRAHSEREDLLTMLTRVTNTMNEFDSESGGKQISYHLSTLRKKVYFPTFLRS